MQILSFEIFCKRKTFSKVSNLGKGFSTIKKLKPLKIKLLQDKKTQQRTDLCFIILPLTIILQKQFIMKTENIDGLTLFEINQLIQQGGRFVMFPNMMTKSKSSTIYFIRPEEKIFKYAIKHFIKNLLNGWRTFPLRPFYVSKSLFYLAIGGQDNTQNILADLKQINPIYNPNLYILEYI
jgi:hypothetical protein